MLHQKLSGWEVALYLALCAGLLTWWFWPSGRSPSGPARAPSTQAPVKSEPVSPCSPIEIEQAKVIDQHLMAASRAAEDGDDALRREARAFSAAARILGITESEAKALYEKTERLCPGAY